MIFEVLLSCMHQTDDVIINRSNLNNVQTLIINQCNVIKDELIKVGDMHRMLNTRTRGLSVSRNLAINKSIADICLIADDDEIFDDDLEEKVIAAYTALPDADIIVFNLHNKKNKLGNQPKKLNKFEILKVASWQISFKRMSVINKVSFDTILGAGTGNGGGEENKFMIDCNKKGLQIYYVPDCIATMIDTGKSTWFHGYTKDFFYNDGKSNRYIMGLPIALCYAVFFLLTKRNIYSSSVRTIDAAKFLFKGILENKLSIEKKL